MNMLQVAVAEASTLIVPPLETDSLLWAHVRVEPFVNSNDALFVIPTPLPVIERVPFVFRTSSPLFVMGAPHVKVELPLAGPMSHSAPLSTVMLPVPV